jgi:DNA polymerase III subunit beta
MPVYCTFERTSLLDAFNSLQNITSKKSNLAILANVLLETEGNGVVLTATDLEVGLRLFVAAEIHGEGSITLPAKKIYEIVRESGSLTVTIEEKENSWVIITADQSTYNLAGVDSSDFPQFPDYDKDSFLTFDSHVFLELIDKVIYSIANEQENVYSLTSVLFEKEKRDGKSYLKLISSDGHRLSIMEKEVMTDVEALKLNEVTLVPKKGVQEWKKFCEGRDVVQISCEQKQLVIKDGGAILVIRLKQGEFPAYGAIADTVQLTNCALISRKPFLESLKRINLFTEDIFHTVQFQIDNEKMVLSSQNADIGNAKDEQTITYEGEQLTIGFNCRYFIETLQVMECDTVEVYINSNNSPCLLRSAMDTGFISIIMPMQL